MKKNPIQLNPPQLQATSFHGGPLLVLAGPGTGKTRVLVSRIIHYLEHRKIKPGNILAITFTNQAAGEIKERVKNCLPSRHSLPFISTFHGWAYSFLKDTLGEKARVPIDERESMHLLKKAAGAMGHSVKAKELSTLLHHLPEDMDGKDLTIYRQYKNTLAEYGLWDFDDLILESIRTLRENSSIRESLWARLPVILIDEFQDLNAPQYELVKLMTEKDGEITAIGDPNQSIYGFRGSSPDFIQKFLDDFPKTKTVFLDTAYRCPQTFLDAAGDVLIETSQTDDPSSLFSQKGKGPCINHMEFSDSNAEAGWVADAIERIVGGLSFDSIQMDKAPGSDFRSLSHVAVLFRLNAIGDEIERALSRRGLPCQRADRFDPLEDKGLRAIWRSIEIIRERSPKYHLLRLSEELKMNEKDIQEKLDGLKCLDPMALMEKFVQDFPIDLTHQAMNSLKKVMTREKDMDSLSLLLQKGVDLLDVKVEGVRLLSIHASKGLEFPVVFIAGCEEGILPMKNAVDDEERRLFYVALTRASEEVYLLSSRKRRIWGTWQELEKSQYIDNILPERIKRLAIRKKRPKKKKRPIQKGLF